MKAKVQAVIEVARLNVGARSQPNKNNSYAALSGHPGQAWAGSFMDSVLRNAGEFTQPSLISTVSALAEYTRAGRIFPSPLPGDLVFYAFSTDGDFAQPHVGLVTDTRDWKRKRVFSAVEGQTASGLKRGPQEDDGVYERLRHETDVLVFVRPRYGAKAKKARGDNGKVVTGQVHMLQPGKRNGQVLRMQQALHLTVGAGGMTRGLFDDATVSAMRRYQLRIGYTASEATGTPTVQTLQRLAFDSQNVFLTAPVQ